METGAAAIGHRLVTFDAQWKVRLEKLIGHIGERGPHRVSVGAVAHRTPGYSAEADLIELIPLAARVEPRVHQMRRRGESGGTQKLRLTLAEETAQHVEDAAER